MAADCSGYRSATPCTHIACAILICIWILNSQMRSRGALTMLMAASFYGHVEVCAYLLVS